MIPGPEWVRSLGPVPPGPVRKQRPIFSPPLPVAPPLSRRSAGSPRRAPGPVRSRRAGIPLTRLVIGPPLGALSRPGGRSGTGAPLPLPPGRFHPNPRRAELAPVPRPRLSDGLVSEPRPRRSSRVPGFGTEVPGAAGSGAGPSSGKFPCGRASPGARPGPASPPRGRSAPFVPGTGPGCRGGRTWGPFCPRPAAGAAIPGSAPRARLDAGEVPARAHGGRGRALRCQRGSAAPGLPRPWLNFDGAQAVAEMGVYLPDSYEKLDWGRPGCFATLPTQVV